MNTCQYDLCELPATAMTETRSGESLCSCEEHREIVRMFLSFKHGEVHTENM